MAVRSYPEPDIVPHLKLRRLAAGVKRVRRITALGRVSLLRSRPQAGLGKEMPNIGVPERLSVALHSAEPPMLRARSFNSKS